MSPVKQNIELNQNMNQFSDRIIRNYVRSTEQVVNLRRGRTDGVGKAHRSVPVVRIAGNSAPRLRGAPYWKTTIRNRGFQKTLYTSSTLRVVVGLDWNPYDNDNH